jgi:hypothetical protein
MGLLVTFAAVVALSAAGIGAVLAGGGTTELVVALAIVVVGAIVVLTATLAALDAG